MTHNTSDSHSGGEADWEAAFVEKGAALEHARWARWQNYLHSFLTWNNELQAWVLPHDKKEHWQRQIQTYYDALSEQEKESDRKEVREYLPLIRTEKSKSYQEGVEAEREKIGRLINSTANDIEKLELVVDYLNNPTNTV